MEGPWEVRVHCEGYYTNPDGRFHEIVGAALAEYGVHLATHQR